MMKKIYYSFILAATALAMGACGGEKEEPIAPTNSVEVTIATSSIETKASASLEFKANDKMNVFAKTFGRLDAPNIVDGVVASYDGAKWTMSPSVMIDDTQKNAFLYAVAPYDAAYTDPAAIPVDLSKQVDLLYSGAYVPASLTSPAVKLNMKHALPLMTFNIIPVNYSGSGSLSEIKLQGDIVYTTAKLNVETGKLAMGDKGVVTAKPNKSITAGGWKSDLPSLWVLPFNTRGAVASIDFVIDGKDYQLSVPEVEMKSGFQYIFRLVLTDNGLEFDPSKTETISLNVDSDTEQNFVGYGRIDLTTSGSWLVVPTLTGDAVFGTIKTPSKSMPYAPALKAEGLSAGQKVVMESWNSNGFEFETLDGIDVIDLTAYE